MAEASQEEQEARARALKAALYAEELRRAGEVQAAKTVENVAKAMHAMNQEDYGGR